LEDDRILLRITDAAARLSLSSAKTYQLCSLGIIPTVTLGTVRRVPAAALEELAATWRTGDAPPR
jgi:excisionase family DNA binding protein